MREVELAPGYRVSRVIKGGWQLAGGHGRVDRDTGIADMIAFCDAGITTFDCADIYTGVEELIGAFRRVYRDVRGSEALARVRVHTKCVPDLDRLGTITRADIERAVDTSLARLGVERLDLVQFHWWDYAVERFVEVASWLDALRERGKIAHLGGTNFDTTHMTALLDAGLPLVAMQVQYSLLDARPAKRMVEAAGARGVQLLCYGSVGGGLLSERWLGAPEPRAPYENRSLTKYKLVVDEFGGWEPFQSLLRTLADIAARHDSDIASIASRLVLERPGVAAVIVGARDRAHLARNAALPDIPIDDADRAAIERALADARTLPGDVYDLERDRDGPHGSIMKYNLNEGSSDG